MGGRKVQKQISSRRYEPLTSPLTVQLANHYAIARDLKFVLSTVGKVEDGLSVLLSAVKELDESIID